MTVKLLIITSHPIQYQAPWFRALHSDDRVELDVLFLALPDARDQGVGFGKAFEWDVPLLQGYRWKKAPSARGRISSGWRGLVWDGARLDIGDMSPQVVLITGWHKFGLLQGIRATSQLGLPLLIRAESNGLAPTSLLKRWRHRWILGHASRLLPIGQANRAFYQRLGLDERLGPDAPYFVDNQFFSRHCVAAASKRDQLRASWGVPADAVCFLFVGKLVDKKNPGHLLDALGHLIESHETAHVLMVGTGPLEQELKSTAAGRKLPVSFTGFLNQTEIPAAYAVADCLVLPSDYGETWGLVVNEAMACGLPAIVSDRVGCGPDLVIEGVTGFRFEFGDVWQLAAVMKKICELPDSARISMRQAARHKVCADYSIARAVESTIAAAQVASGDRR